MRDAVLANAPQAEHGFFAVPEGDRIVTDLTDLGVAAIRDGVRAGALLGARSGRRVHRRGRAAAKALNAFLVETPDHALAAARPPTRRAPRASRSSRSPACRSASRTCSAPRACRRRRRATSSKASCPTTNRPSRRSCGTPARGCSASSTWTSSRWARRTRRAISATSSRRGGARRRQRAARAGRIVGRHRRRRSRRGCARRRPAPTPAARSASPRRSPASPGSSRPMAAARAGAWSRSPQSLDQAGPMARDVRDCAIMLEAMAGFDAKDATSLDSAVPHWEAGLIAQPQGQARRHPQGISRRQHARGDRGAVAAGHRLAARTPAPRWSRCRCRTPNTRCRPITSSRRPRPRPTSRAMTACATACATCPTARTCRTCTRRPAPPASGAEVKRRIMIGTYVLSAGFYDAYYTQAQKVRALIARDFERGVGDVRRAADPDRALGRVRAGREDRPIRSRCISTTSSPCRSAWPGCRRCACRAGSTRQGLPLGLQIIGKALDEQGVLERGPRDRGARGVRGAAGSLVVG